MITKFKGSKLTQRIVVNNIIRYYNMATEDQITEGKNWYHDAHNFCLFLSKKHNYPMDKVVGILSATSPKTSWKANKQFCSLYISTRRQVSSGNIHTKCGRIDAGEDIPTVLNGEKTKAFFDNILNPYTSKAVTIDRHAIAACIQHPSLVYPLPDEVSKITPLQYAFFSECYIKASNKLDLSPCNLQAIVWVVYRSLRNLN